MVDEHLTCSTFSLSVHIIINMIITSCYMYSTCVNVSLIQHPDAPPLPRSTSIQTLHVNISQLIYYCSSKSPSVHGGFVLRVIGKGDGGRITVLVGRCLHVPCVILVTATKFAKIMFLHLSVSHSVHWGGGVPHPGESASGGSASMGEGGLHPAGEGGWADIPPPDTTGYGQRAGGTHLTGMHSCLRYFWVFFSMAPQFWLAFGWIQFPVFFVSKPIHIH